jgi:hypothetical protein
MDHRLSGQHITASNPFLFFSFFFFPVCVLSVSHTSLQVPGESRNYVEPLIVSIRDKKALIVWELNMYALYTSQCCVVTHTTFLPSHSPTISRTVFKFIPVRSLASIQIPIVWSSSWDFFHGSDLPSTASSLFSINIVIITYTDRTHLICIDIQNLKKKESLDWLARPEHSTAAAVDQPTHFFSHFFISLWPSLFIFFYLSGCPCLES